jgi:molybdopterin synthase catalytic subunit
MTLLRQGYGGRAVALTDSPFDPGALLSEFSQGRREVGAVATFTGIARAEAGETTTLELEAYPGFTEGEIGRIADEARTRFALDDLMVRHRVGKIAPGEPIVFVATAARHRRAAFEACDYLMDYLKSRAPFWKKEHGPDGARWIEPRAEDHADIARWEETP